MKRYIDVFDYTAEILSGVKQGVLLTTKTQEKTNSMVISWGTLGIEWNKPIFTTYVREHRFTKGQLDKNPEFTINIPIGDYDKKIIGICGSKSGHDIDKINEANLTLVDADEISVPAVKEFALTLECRVVYRQEQAQKYIIDPELERMYPRDVDSSFHGSNKDYHTVYYGEIVKAYILE